MSFYLQNIDRRVEILGFTEESRKAYIEEALQNNSQHAENLLTYLKGNPAIDAQCFIPLNMAIVLSLYVDSEYANPSVTYTQTEISQAFICITISRFIREREREEPIQVLKTSQICQQNIEKHFKTCAD